MIWPLRFGHNSKLSLHTTIVSLEKRWDLDGTEVLYAVCDDGRFYRILRCVGLWLALRCFGRWRYS